MTHNETMAQFHRNARHGLDRAVESHMINLFQVLLVSKPGDTQAIGRARNGIKAAETAFLDLTAYLDQCYASFSPSSEAIDLPNPIKKK